MGQDDVEVAVITPESAPLAMFGEQASESLRRDLDEAGVTSSTRRGADASPGRRAIALPRGGRAAGRRPAADERGFVPVDAHGRVPGFGERLGGGRLHRLPDQAGRPGRAAGRRGRRVDRRLRGRGRRPAAVPPRPARRPADRPRPALDPPRARDGRRPRRGPAARAVVAADEGRRRATWRPYLAMHAHGRLPDDERPAGRLVEFPVPVGGAVMTRVLVLYASTHGHTGRIAARDRRGDRPRRPSCARSTRDRSSPVGSTTRSSSAPPSTPATTRRRSSNGCAPTRRAQRDAVGVLLGLSRRGRRDRRGAEASQRYIDEALARPAGRRA